MYNMLPSQVQEQATIFDIMVTEVYTTWEKYKLNPNDQNLYRTENLEEVLRKAKGS